MNYTWKDWQSVQKMIDLYDNHRIRYYIYLLWVILQSVIAIALVAAFIYYLLYSLLFRFNRQYASWGFYAIVLLIAWLWVCTRSICNRSNFLKGLFKLDRKKYAPIYDFVNDVSRSCNGPKIHDIYINLNYNVCGTSRYHFTPFRRNILILGYPLLCALSCRGLTVCLTREIYHIKRNRKFVSNWYPIINAVFTGFVIPWIRYWDPVFEKAIAPIHRKQNFDANKFIVTAFGEDYLAAYLVESLLKFESYSDVIDKIISQMRSDSWNERDIPRLIRDGLHDDLPEERGEQTIACALQSVPNVFDERPSFAQLLELANSRYPMRFAQFDADALERIGVDVSELESELNAFLHLHLDNAAFELNQNAKNAQQWLTENPPSVDAMDEFDLVYAIKSLERAGRNDEKLNLLKQSVGAYPNFTEFRARLALESAISDPDYAAKELDDCVEQVPVLSLLDDNDFLFIHALRSGDIEKVHSYLDKNSMRIEQINSQLKRELDENDIIEPELAPPQIQEYLIKEFKKIAIKRAFCIKRRIDNKTSIDQRLIVLDSNKFNVTSYNNAVQNLALSNLYNSATFYLLSTNVVHAISHALSAPASSVVFGKKAFCDKYLEPLPGAKFYSRR